MGTGAVTFTDGARRIVVVDDEAEMRALLRDFLAAQGYPVEAFASAGAALTALTPDSAAVISDFDLGGGSTGLDFLKAVKARYPTLPIFLMTAHPSRELEAEAKSVGVCDCLTKPFPLSLLAQVLRRTLSSEH